MTEETELFSPNPSAVSSNISRRSLSETSRSREERDVGNDTILHVETCGAYRKYEITMNHENFNYNTNSVLVTHGNHMLFLQAM